MKIEEITCNITKSRIYESDNDSLSASQIEVIKSSDIPKEKIIKLDDDTIFQFDCLIDDDEQYLSFKLSEIDAVAPYIYIKNIKLDEIKRVHKMFRACDDLTEVKKKQKKKIIQQKKQNQILRIKINKKEKWELIQPKKSKSGKEKEGEDENNDIIGLKPKNTKEGKKGKKKKRQFEDVDIELGFKIK